MDATSIVATAVATSIKASRKFRKAEHEIASAYIASEMQKAMKAGDMKLAMDLTTELGRISNISQLSQDLAKAGLVSHGDPSAFARQVGEALDGLGSDAVAPKP